MTRSEIDHTREQSIIPFDNEPYAGSIPGPGDDLPRTPVPWGRLLWFFGLVALALTLGYIFNWFVGIVAFIVAIFAGFVMLVETLRKIEPNPLDPESQSSDDASWPLPRKVSRFRAARPNERKLRAGEKYYVVKHWTTLLTYRTVRSRRILYLILTWYLVDLIVLPFFTTQHGGLAYLRLVSVTAGSLYIVGRVTIYLQFDSRYNFAIATVTGITIYQGWWRPKKAFIARDKFTDQQVLISNPLIRLFGIDVGTLDIDSAGRSANLDLKQVAWVAMILVMFQSIAEEDARRALSAAGDNIDRERRQLEISEALLDENRIIREEQIEQTKWLALIAYRGFQIPLSEINQHFGTTAVANFHFNLNQPEFRRDEPHRSK